MRKKSKNGAFKRARKAYIKRAARPSRRASSICTKAGQKLCAKFHIAKRRAMCYYNSVIRRQHRERRRRGDRANIDNRTRDKGREERAARREAAKRSACRGYPPPSVGKSPTPMSRSETEKPSRRGKRLQEGMQKMKPIKNKTYRNFLQIMKYLQEVKHYDEKNAEKIAHIVFNNVEADAKWAGRDARYFAARVLTAEEYAAGFAEEAQA